MQFLWYLLKGFLTSQTGCLLPVVFRESVIVGETRASPEEVQQMVQSLGDSFRGTSYHLLQRNCNHFSDMLCERLTGQPAPLWVCCRLGCTSHPHTCLFMTLSTCRASMSVGHVQHDSCWDMETHGACWRCLLYCPALLSGSQRQRQQFWLQG